METEILIVILVVAALLILGAVAWAAARRRKRRHLQERFGREYDRTVERSDSARKAERELLERERQRDDLDIRTLSTAERDRYRGLWENVQASFVDRPEGAVREADELVGEVMRARGYPVDDFDRRAELVSVDHPQVVEHYRHAHAVAERDVRGEVSTEDRRQALVHFRSLFEILLRDDSSRADGDVDLRDRAPEPMPEERHHRV